MNTREVLGKLRDIEANAQRTAEDAAALRRVIETEPQNAALIDQHASDMSKKRHCAATRRRISQGLPGAFIDGRRFLLSREALEEELGLGTRARLAKAVPRRPTGVASCPADNDTVRVGEGADDEVQSILDRIARKSGRVT